MVWPSGCDLASAAVATMVPAPGRFSITTDWPPQRADSRSARMRATTSVGPPAAKRHQELHRRVGKSAGGLGRGGGHGGREQEERAQ